MLKKLYEAIFWRQAFDSFFDSLDSSRCFRRSDRRFDEKRLYWREFGSREGLSPQMAAYKAMIDCAIIVSRDRGDLEWRERFLRRAIFGLSTFLPDELSGVYPRDVKRNLPGELHEYVDKNR